MRTDYTDITKDPSGFVLLSDVIPSIVQEIRYYSSYNFVGDRIDGYEEPCSILTKEAARALKTDLRHIPSGNCGQAFRSLGDRGYGYPHETVFLSGSGEAGTVPQGLRGEAVEPQQRKHRGPDAS